MIEKFYYKIHYKTPYRKALFIVAYRMINNNIKYLILKRKLHWKGWEFPKGGVELFETKKMGVKREIVEETSLTPKIITNHKTCGKYDYKKNLPDRPYKGQSYQLYSVELEQGSVKVDHREHSSYLWLPYEKAIKKLTWSNQKECLKIVNNSLVN
ncbi:NUDIX domain-containing protein [Candidatus Pacearchaeota archaeon]|nr:NUDIX domain-containing protein [Candidatus Pacearchaeota archaeon]